VICFADCQQQLLPGRNELRISVAVAAGHIRPISQSLRMPLEIVKFICESYAMLAIEISDQPSVANCMKIIINYAGISIIEILGEPCSFTEKSDIDLAYLQQFFNMALPHSVMKLYTAKARKRDYKEGFGFIMGAGLKDGCLMLSATGQTGVAFAIGRIIERKMLAAFSSDLRSGTPKVRSHLKP